MAGTRRVITTIGILQILAWGSSFYLLTILAPAITAQTGWPSAFVVSGLSLALLVAGLVSPRIGHTIQRFGGRPVLAASSVLFAIGLCILAVAPVLPVYLAGWCVIGLAMSAGLYDPAFATLGRHYGEDARRMITAVTLFGGFASTVCWPLSAWLLENHGWRITCATYAGLHVLIGLPAYLFLLPKRPPELLAKDGPKQVGASELPLGRQRTALILLGSILTFGAVILSMVSAHLVTLLQTRGIELATAVALGALIGPSQVAARVVEMTLGRRFHPLWTMLIGVALVAFGILLLWSGLPVIAVALIAYGAGNGISSIVRGTVPLVLFGPSRYAVLMGKLGLPILIGMAAAPTLGAILIETGGARLTYGTLAMVSLANVGLSVVLLRFCAVSKT